MTSGSDRLHSTKRRAELFALIEKVGFFNISPVEMSKKYGVTRQQISKDLKIIASHIEPTDIDVIKAEMDGGHKRMLKQVHNISITSPDEKIKVQAARAYGELSEKYARFLEAFNLKKQLAQKSELIVKWKT